MDIKQLFECLTDYEKQQLRQLLNGTDNDVLVTDFIKTTNCSLRLYNTIMRKGSFDGMFLKDISFSYYTKQRNAGQRTWDEFVTLRNEYFDKQ